MKPGAETAATARTERPSRRVGMETADTSTSPPAVAGRYRCGLHPERVISWKGTGCPECAADLHRYRERRRIARARRRSWDDDGPFLGGAA